MVDSVDKRPTDAQLDEALEKLYLRAVARPWAQVSADDRQIMTGLFQSVSSKHGPDHGWRAVCAAMFASEDYAIY
jgi:hypothetical protein